MVPTELRNHGQLGIATRNNFLVVDATVSRIENLNSLKYGSTRGPKFGSVISSVAFIIVKKKKKRIVE